MADSTPVALTTGSEPGMPRQVGQVCELGAAPSSVEHPQNILVLVPSSTWTSRPMTGSYVARASSYDTSSSVVVVTVKTSLSAQQDVVVAQAPELPVEDGEAGDDGGGGHGRVDEAQRVVFRAGLLGLLGDADGTERGGRDGQVRAGLGLLEA